MYKCNCCGITGERPDRPYDSDENRYEECGHCGSEDIVKAECYCEVCGKPLYDGDMAYMAGKILICGSCLTEVLI